MSFNGKKIKPEKIKKSEFFSSFNSSELHVIAENSSLRTVKSGGTVFIEGDDSTGLYIVEKGEIVIRKPDNENRNIDIARFLPGDCFGELDMLTGARRNESAFAEKDTVLIVFPGDGVIFRDMLVKYPEISARILHKFLVQISGRIRNANSLVSENSPVVKELSRQVYRDKLTGRYNKTYLEEKIRELLNASSGTAAMVMVKPDNFKAINDAYGHDAGDRVLIIMTGKLHDYLPDNYVIVRYMGNELGIFIPDAGREASLQAAEKIRKFLQSLDLSKACEGNSFTLSVSQGIALYPDHTDDPENLILFAHELPLTGRARGGNKILFYDDIHPDINCKIKPCDVKSTANDPVNGKQMNNRDEIQGRRHDPGRRNAPHPEGRRNAPHPEGRRNAPESTDESGKPGGYE